MMCKKVAVVGAGIGGIVMGKALKEDNIDFICFEKTESIGGTWCYREDDINGVATIMSTTVMNTSKEMCSISNHPFPDDGPNFMRHQNVYSYVVGMAEKYDVLRHIVFNKEVVLVKRTEDYDVTGRWVVTVKDTKTKEVVSEVFDAVMLCAGQFGEPFIPQYPGTETFQGRISHCHSLKTFESFTNKKVAVVGFGCSALDAAVEISRVAKQVYLSSRNQAWVLSRVSLHGIPYDYILQRRCFTYLLDLFPARQISPVLEKYFVDFKFKHSLFGIQPSEPALSREPVLSDDIVQKLMSGSVILKNNIKQIGQNEVMFENENEAVEIDEIVMSTGYRQNFPFLEEGILQEEEPGKFNLYKCMYPIHLKQPTLAFIGFLLVWGPGFVVGELQTRWASYLLSGKGSLPRQDIMKKEIDQRFEINVARYVPSEKMSQRVDLSQYSDLIASEIGAKPNFLKMAFTDFKLFIACIFGPFVSYQYRLQGPHKWDGARDAIFSVHERIKRGFKSEQNRNKQRTISFVPVFLISLCLIPLLFSIESILATCWLILTIIICLIFATIILRKIFPDIYGKLLLAIVSFLARLVFIAFTFPYVAENYFNM